MLPISHADAQPLLAALEGPVAPATWRGALPITYHIGPGAGEECISPSQSDWSLKPIYDVIAMIKGSERSGRMGRARQSPRRLGVRREGSAVGQRRADGRGQGDRRARSKEAGGRSARSSMRAGTARSRA